MRKFVLWRYVVILALFVFLFSGCGGGSSGGGGSNETPTTPPNTQTPEPEPDEPTPVPNVEYDITTILSGDSAWEGTNGSGTATGPDGTFDLRLVSARVAVKNLEMMNETGTAYVTANINWDVHQNNSYVRTIEQRWYSKQVDIAKAGTNTWRFSFSSTTSRLTIQLTSNSTVQVTEDGTTYFGVYNYQYSGSYNLTKQQ